MRDELRLLEDYRKARKSRVRLKDPLATQSKFVDQKDESQQLKSMLRTASKMTQAVLKISSYGKGIQKIKNHVSYISRHGTLTLEDQYGNLYEGKQDQQAIIDAWSIDFGTRTESRDTMHMVLSSPPGSDPESIKKAGREFLTEQFGEKGHEFIFVTHTDTNHPHVHAVVKMKSTLGLKLNPRKADLRAYRERFAEICRSKGIQVEASPRCERGLSGASKKSSIVYMKKRGVKPRVETALIQKVKQEQSVGNNSPHPSQEKMNKRNQIIRKRYADMAKKVAQKAEKLNSPDEKKKYQHAAGLLDYHAMTMPVEKSRGDQVHDQLNQRVGITTLSIEDRAIMDYLAVTHGQPDKKGVYKAPLEVAVEKLAKIKQKETLQKTAQNKQSLEIDIDE